jgi:hypothetical protein
MAVGRRSDRERLPTTADIGISRKETHEARILRDAENADPNAPQAKPAQGPVRWAAQRMFAG